MKFVSSELMTCVLQYALPTKSTEAKNKMNEYSNLKHKMDVNNMTIF